MVLLVGKRASVDCPGSSGIRTRQDDKWVASTLPVGGPSGPVVSDPESLPAATVSCNCCEYRFQLQELGRREPVRFRCVDGRSERYAAFLQNASIPALPYPGFHPGLVCSAPLGHSKSGQPKPAQPTKKPQRSGVRPERALEAITTHPSRTARKLLLPRAYSARGGLIPRS